jgi:hypothetical protein
MIGFKRKNSGIIRKANLMAWCFMLLALANNVSAQEHLALQIDFLGAAPYGSLSLEKSIIIKKGVEIKLKAGIGLAGYNVVEPPRTFIKYTPTIPAGINFLIGRSNKRNNIEIGFQGTYIKEMSVSDAWDPALLYTNNLKKTILASVFAGYRFRPFKGRGIIRVGYNPVLLHRKWINWGALTLGWSFKKKYKKNLTR